ncbi:MAG: hypothetical protein M3O31_11135 [Acidobacteriota bacterium]|nr:hypothetical protein [Acidobacteriota bacterium]
MSGQYAAQYPRNRTCDTLHQDGLCGTEQRNGANSNFQSFWFAKQGKQGTLGHRRLLFV